MSLSKILSAPPNHDWYSWIRFFLQGIIEQAKSNTVKANDLSKLYDGMKEIIFKNIHSSYAIRILDFIFLHPLFKAHQLIEFIPEVSPKTIYNLLNQFRKLGILGATSNKRNKIYYCPQIVEKQ